MLMTLPKSLRTMHHTFHNLPMTFVYLHWSFVAWAHCCSMPRSTMLYRRTHHMHPPPWASSTDDRKGFGHHVCCTQWERAPSPTSHLAASVATSFFPFTLVWRFWHFTLGLRILFQQHREGERVRKA
jgi:hypothetical protein